MQEVAICFRQDCAEAQTIKRSGFVQAELLDLVAKEKERTQPVPKKKKGKKAGRLQDREEAENEGSKDQPVLRHCRKCAALQHSCRCEAVAAAGNPGALPPLHQPPSMNTSALKPAFGPNDGSLRSSETEAGRWEIQHAKRRGIAQVCCPPTS